MPPTQLKRLQDAYRKAAELVLMDPVYLPIFERLEKELLAAEAAGDAVARARAVAALHRAKA